MKTTLTITTREIARRELAETRYGLGAEPISDPTLWRWCRACGVGIGQSTFHQHEMGRLHQVARMLADSHTMNHVKQHFGVNDL
jgi:hypothetical protein